MRRPPSALIAALLALAATLALVACGGSDGTSDATAEVPGAVVQEEAGGDPFVQLRFVLSKFPYRPYYRDCLVREVEAELSSAELKELAHLPPEEARNAALRFALGASPKCERNGRKPVDPKADAVEVQLLRLGYSTTLETLGRKEGLSEAQAECLGRVVSEYPDAKVIAFGNASEKRREAILVGVIESCAKSS